LPTVIHELKSFFKNCLDGFIIWTRPSLEKYVRPKSKDQELSTIIETDDQEEEQIEEEKQEAETEPQPENQPVRKSRKPTRRKSENQNFQKKKKMSFKNDHSKIS
jgi:hypothetical protein